MGSHLIDGEFQSDKYPTCPRGKVPLSVKDPTAQDLLWEYAQRRRAVDAEFSDDLETALVAAGFKVVVCVWCGSRHRTIMGSDTQGNDCAAGVWQDEDGRWMLTGGYGSTLADMSRFVFVKNAPTARAAVVCDACIQQRIDAGDLELIDDNYLGDPDALAALGRTTHADGSS
jgi:hypothetical protein